MASVVIVPSLTPPMTTTTYLEMTFLAALMVNNLPLGTPAGRVAAGQDQFTMWALDDPRVPIDP